MINFDSNIESIHKILPRFRYVKFNSEKLKHTLDLVITTSELQWSKKIIFRENSWKGLNHLALFSSLSFCFWDSYDWHFEVKNNKIWGSYALFYALGRAIDNGLPMYSAEFLIDLSLKQFQDIMLGKNDTLPSHLEERYSISKKFAEELLMTSDGKILGILKDSKFNASRFHQLLYDSFSIFKDEIMLYGKKIYFCKKSLEVITLAVEQFQGEGVGNISGMELFIGSSDYKIPQILNTLGLIEYNQSLENRIREGYIFNEDDIEVQEIRAMTIFAIRQLSTISENLIDANISNRLWNLSQKESFVTSIHPLKVLTQRF